MCVEGDIGFHGEALESPETHLFPCLLKPEEMPVAMSVQGLAKFDGPLHFAHFELAAFELGEEHSLDPHAVNGLVLCGLG